MGQAFQIFLLIFGLTYFLSLQAAVPDPAKTYVMCKSNKVVRTIRVEKDSTDKSCVTFYTKSGVDREVGRAINMASCTRIADNIKTNLVNANWKCRDVSEVQIISPEEE